jgi:exoribonuclease-2
MNVQRQRAILQRIAHQAMLDRGLLPDFSRETLAELDRCRSILVGNRRAPTDLLWLRSTTTTPRPISSPSLNLARRGEDPVAAADVDASQEGLRDRRARAAEYYLSLHSCGNIPDASGKAVDGSTSLGFHEDRPAIIIEMVVDADGSFQDSKVYQAVVRNKAKLAYNSMAAWLEGEGPVPEPVKAVEGLDANIRTQDLVAQKLKASRYEHGALDLETIQARPVFDNEEIRDLEVDKKNRSWPSA